ncbi:MAG TPA: choice-of-anchor tandem repeat NxxGxxAF-containing protein [Verrucomicrobiales bacterium]|nr:choice-of-anchor tandem repeat NxxGxxAF-containing protein [Verrucomicrobiales bacterium]
MRPLFAKCGPSWAQQPARLALIAATLIGAAMAAVELQPLALPGQVLDSKSRYSADAVHDARVNRFGDVVVHASVRDSFASGPAARKAAILRLKHDGSFEPIAVQGDLAPPWYVFSPVADSRYTSFAEPAIADSGAVAYAANLDSRVVGKTLWVAPAGKTPFLMGGNGLFPLLRQEDGGWTSRDPAGELVTFNAVDAPMVSQDGAGFFAAQLRRGEYEGRYGVWFLHADRYRYSIPENPRRPFPFVFDGLPTKGNGPLLQVVRVRTPVVAGGRIALVATVTNTGSPAGAEPRDGIWIARDPGGNKSDLEPQLLALSGDTLEGAPGRVLGQFGIASINAQGQVAFIAALTGGAGDPGETLVRTDPGKTWAVTSTGASAQGWPRAAVFDRFLDPSLNSAGSLAFVASVRRNGPSGPVDGRGLWWAGPEGALQLAAKSGDAAPGFPAGSVLESFGQPRLTDTGSIVFNAMVRGNSIAPLNALDTGCWVWEPGAGLQLIARRGMKAPDAAGIGRTVQSFSLADVSATGVGLLQIRLTSGGTGLYRFLEPDALPPSVPERVRVSADSYDRVSLSWADSVDDRFVREYVVYRNGLEVGRTREPAWIDLGFRGGENLRYEIAAADLRGNLSARSPAAQTKLPVAGAEVVVDDRQAIYQGSPWWGPSHDADVVGANSSILHRNSSAAYRPDLPVTGRYAVYAWISGTSPGGEVERRDSTARYLIRHANGGVEWVIDQNDHIGQWAWLGSYPFRLGESGDVTVFRDDEGLPTVADALRWVLLPEDSQAPGTPTQVVAEWEASRRVRLHWGAVSDASEVIVYHVYRDGVFLGETAEWEFLDRLGVPGAQHLYTVEAVDFFGNRSPASAPVALTLPSSGAEIVVDDRQAVNLGPGWWRLSGDSDAWDGDSRLLARNSAVQWNANLPARGLYEVWVWVSARQPDGSAAKRDNAADYSVEYAGGFAEIILDQNARTGQWAFLGTWEFPRGGGVVTLRRQDSNRSTVADALRFVLLPDDSEAPPIPASVTATWESASRVRLRWEEVSDASDSVFYRIYRDGKVIGESDRTDYLDAAAVPGATYSYSVEAMDFHGNTLGPGQPAAVTLPMRGMEIVLEETEAEWSPQARPLTDNIDAHGGTSRFLSEGGSATWKTTLPVSGPYEVWVWISGRHSSGAVGRRNESASYSIQHAAGAAAVEFDQNARIGAWSFLGAWEFQRNEATSLTLRRDLEEPATVADAVRFRLLLGENQGPPSIPQGLSVHWLASDRAELQWAPSRDDLDAVIYRVRRNGLEAGETNSTSLVDLHLQAGTEYRYTVEAYDYHEKGSGPSAEVALQTPERGLEVVVEDTRAVYLGSPWWGVSNAADAHGANSYVLHKNSQATLPVDLPARATYELWAWIPGTRLNGTAIPLDREAEYSIQHAGGLSEIVLNQDISRGGWAWLGTWEFDRGSSAPVTVFRQDDERSTMVDAFRWVMLPGDTEPPTPPGELSATWESSRSVQLQWQPSFDVSAAVTYRIFRDGALVAETEDTSYLDGLATPGAQHRYAVAAVDFHGNTFGPGTPVSVRLPERGVEIIVEETEAEFENAVRPLTGNIDAHGGTSRSLTKNSWARWDVSLPVSGSYSVWIWVSAMGPDGTLAPRDTAADYTVIHAGGISTEVLDQNLNPGNWAFLQSWRFDKGPASITVARQDSGRSLVVDAVRFRLLLEENRAVPSVPSSLQARWLASDRAELRWTASQDDLDAVIYEVRRDGAVVGQTSGFSYVDAPLEPGREYSYSVEAVDYHGERSGGSPPASVRLPEPGWIVLVDDTEALYQGSPWWGVSNAADAYGANSYVLQKNSQAIVTPTLPARANYEVWAWIPSHRSDGTFFSLDDAVEYDVHHAAGTETVILNQAQASGSWAWLGTWEFLRGSLGNITVRRQDHSSLAMVDALKWVMLPDDSDPPPAPEAPWVWGESASRVRLAWGPVEDASAFVRYVVFRDGLVIAETPELSFTDLMVEPGGEHAYSLSAVDFHGNTSAHSPEAKIRLPRRGLEVVVDDADVENLSTAWLPLSGDLDVFGLNSRLLPRGVSAQWTANLPLPGRYEVWVWTSGRRADGEVAVRDRAADYKILHAAGTAEIIFDQNRALGQWAWLGSWEFPRGETQISVHRQTSGSATVVDAVKWVLLEPAPVPVDPGFQLEVVSAEPGHNVVLLFHLGTALAARTVSELQIESLDSRAIHAAVTALGDGQWRAAFAYPPSAQIALLDVEVVFTEGDSLRLPAAFALGNLTGDSDGDGIPTLVELMLGMDPERSLGSREEAQLRLPSLRPLLTGEVEISWIRRKGVAPAHPSGPPPSGAKLTYSLQVSNDWASGLWQDAEPFAAGPEETLDRGDGTERVRRTLQFPAGWRGEAWVRLQARWKLNP